MPDIDIDFPNRDEVLKLFKHIPASRKEGGNLLKHNTGVYLHNVPVDATAGACKHTFNSKKAEEYFKIDFLNFSLYEGIKSELHLVELMNKEPMWELLEQDDFVDLLYHVNTHGKILRQTKPKSIPELAAVIAMIRPAKRYLVGKSWDVINKEIWKKPEGDQYFFKKSHAHAYAVAIVVQMNLIVEEMTS